MSNQKEYSELKKRALLAKKRMKMGYWQQLQKEREELLEEVGASEIGQHKISEVQRARYIRDNNKSINNNQTIRDEMLYKKVKNMLDEDEYTLNPIGQLMDKNIYNKLDEQNKQRYVLELSNKYHELRDRYYRERTSFSIKS